MKASEVNDMPKIVLENITKRWKKFYAVENLNLVIEDNAFVTLLGPSGCGKTTTLRMIAGLETPTEGRITIGDKVVFDSAAGINVPANKRKVGFLFQNYALWPNMTVFQNISFGLSNINEPGVSVNENGEVIRLTEKGARVQGTGKVLFTLAKDGAAKQIEVDLGNIKLLRFTAPSCRL